MNTAGRNISYHPRSLKRNQELHNLLTFIGERPDLASLECMAKEFGWMPRTLQANLVILRRANLIQIANGKPGYGAMYTLGTYTQAELEALLPLKAPEGYVLPKPAMTLKEKAALRSALPVGRDPMTALLMGGFRAAAPSLNFTDSTHGV